MATLDALMASRRREPGDLVFQGGTSPHLAYGSPGYSEDLDFLVNSSRDLQSVAKAVEARLEGASWLLPQGAKLVVSKGKDARNPHTFVVAIGGPDLIGAVRVKVELWRAPESTAHAVKATVSAIRLASGAASGLQTFVSTAELPEIYVDEVFALGARPDLKARDVLDLDWTSDRSAVACRTCRSVTMRAASRTQISAFERLRDLPALFRGGDLTRRFGWTSKTASQYLYLWKRRGLVLGLGGHSDVHAILLAGRHPDWEEAVVMAMPSAVLVGIEALRRAGWTTQLVQRPTVAVKSGHPVFKTDHFNLMTRNPHWFNQVTSGTEVNRSGGLRTLRPAWALADLLHHTRWERSGLSPDDIEWSEAASAERDWRAARKAFGLAPVSITARIRLKIRVSGVRFHPQPPINQLSGPSTPGACRAPRLLPGCSQARALRADQRSGRAGSHFRVSRPSLGHGPVAAAIVLEATAQRSGSSAAKF